MESKLINLTSPNKRKETINDSFSLIKKSNREKKILSSIKQDINPYLKRYYSTAKKLFSSRKNKNKTSNTNNKEDNHFLIPYSISSLSKTNIKTKNSPSFMSQTKFKRPILSTPKLSTESKYFFPQNLSQKFCFSDNRPSDITIKSFLNKKRKYMTSEEIELEKIEKERADTKKMIEKNRNLYYKSLFYTPIKIIPTALTTFKPFNLSSSKSSKYLKEGKSNTLYEINKLNQKIRQKMQQKIEALTDTKTKEQILLNNTDYLKKQNSLYNDLFKKPQNVNNINLENNNISLDENKKRIQNYLTPQKNCLNLFKRGFDLFNSLSKGNSSNNLTSQIKRFDTNKKIDKSKIINYYFKV
jgi:hypothetical protein